MTQTKTRALTEGALMVAAATALSYVKLLELPQGGVACGLPPHVPGRDQDGGQRRPVEIEPVKECPGGGAGTQGGISFAQDKNPAAVGKAAGHPQGRLLQQGGPFFEECLAQTCPCPAVCGYDVLRCVHDVVLHGLRPYHF